MAPELVVRNCKVVLPKGVLNGGVAVAGGRISKIASDPNLPRADSVVDGRGRYLLPGPIDSHVHLREPGYEYKEDFRTGTMAAAAGGVTSVVDMPSGVPYIDSVEHLRMKFGLAAGRAFVDYGQNCMLGDDNLDELEGMVNAGAVGFKLYMSKTAVKVSVPSDAAVLDAFGRLAKLGVATSVHAENDAIITRGMEKVERSGAKDIFSYAEGRPKIAEVEAIQRVALFSRHSGNRIHILHLTSRDGVGEVAKAKKSGTAITGETCPHYLLLTRGDLGRVGSIARINPPIRGNEGDRAALWEAVANGTIDTIGSDHSPHRPDEKEKENVWEAASGFAGVETIVPLMLTQVRKRRITLRRFVQLLSENPARMLDIYPKKGALRVGSDADFLLADFRRGFKIRSEDLKSKTKVTPFEGWEVTASPAASFLRGKMIMQDGEVIGEPSGAGVKATGRAA
jgi:dihydroorotase